MFIKIKRTQVCTSGHYHSGVTYEIDAKNHLQVRDAKHMVERGFAVSVSKPKIAAADKAAADKAAADKAAADKAAADKAAADKAAADKAAADKAAADKAAADKAAADKTAG
jgi:membrane protein involved in colicin uptake